MKRKAGTFSTGIDAVAGTFQKESRVAYSMEREQLASLPWGNAPYEIQFFLFKCILLPSASSVGRVASRGRKPDVPQHALFPGRGPVGWPRDQRSL